MSDRHTVQPYPLRLQPELRAALEKLAAESGKSLHAEIVSRLEGSLRPEAFDTIASLRLAKAEWDAANNQAIAYMRADQSSALAAWVVALAREMGELESPQLQGVLKLAAKVQAEFKELESSKEKILEEMRSVGERITSEIMNNPALYLSPDIGQLPNSEKTDE